MKKTLLFLALCGLIGTANAQFEVETPEGDPIEDGSIYTFGTAEYPDALLNFFVRNTGSAAIDTNISVEAFSNTDGVEMELCYLECYNGVSVGQVYPINQTVTIQPGETQTSTEDHFLNTDPGDGSSIIEYEFKFFEVDGDGNEIGDPLTVFYRYDPNLSSEEASKIDANLLTTVVSNNIRIQAQEPLNMEVYDIQGRLVQQNNVSVGVHSIPMSDKTSSVYIVTLTDAEGNRFSQKIVKR
ncbi:T9SS type A sorting domain-containing protein [Luteirhabdus pelagi]|uniref:T9SS type A sorting domain-containing protein n=1 Tax=Luteirhabdus pelagi TaxID=2792783 RepID=UPI0019396BA3|nr:T9SS type A sorting domain-containing protein [Luteirhabdus pelagi]